MIPPGGRRSYQQIVSAILEDLGRTGVLTDTSPGSVTRTLVEAFGRELAASYAQLGHVYDMGFIETAEGAALDRLVALLGIERVEGAAAWGTIVLRRDPRVSGRVFIPEGTEIQLGSAAGDKRASYRTSEDGEIPEGAAEASISIVAALDKPDGSGDILLDAADVEHGSAQLASEIAGVAGLSLAAPTAVRGLRETDEELRERTRGAIEAAGGGTRKALERAVLETGHVQAVELRDATGADGQLRPGELEVVADADFGAPNVLQDLERAIQAAKGPGILVHLRAVARRQLALRLRLKPVNPALGVSERRMLRDRADQLIRQRLDRLQLGEGLVWNRWLAELLSLEGVLDIDLASSSLTLDASAPAPPGDIDVEKLERLVLADRPGALAIDIADEHTLVAGLEVILPTTPAGSRDAVRAAVAEAWIAALDAVNSEEPPEALELVEVLAKIETAISDVTLHLEHLVIQVFSLEDQATAELRAGERETYWLDDRDFLQPDASGPLLRWPT
ncbi:MAG: hypothetical protein AAF560_23215 [Acidobacteriota bacterium]